MEERVATYEKHAEMPSKIDKEVAIAPNDISIIGDLDKSSCDVCRGVDVMSGVDES